MPTILRIGSYRFFFYSAEHLPTHVHVEHGENVAKFELEPVRLVMNRGFRGSEVTRLRAMVIEHRDLFRESWHEFFSNSI
jgi:hypothetical protein